MFLTLYITQNLKYDLRFKYFRFSFLLLMGKCIDSLTSLPTHFPSLFSLIQVFCDFY